LFAATVLVSTLTFPVPRMEQFAENQRATCQAENLINDEAAAEIEAEKELSRKLMESHILQTCLYRFELLTAVVEEALEQLVALLDNN
jgi:hypothetical protein